MASQSLSTSELGGSLPVENVQELSSHNLKDIPNRYIRPELDSNVSVDESLQIPIIDMSKLCSGQSKGYDEELAELHQACKDWGFFQLINHGAAHEVIEEMKVVTEEFFKLPLQEKNEVCSRLWPSTRSVRRSKARLGRHALPHVPPCFSKKYEILAQHSTQFQANFTQLLQRAAENCPQTFHLDGYKPWDWAT